MVTSPVTPLTVSAERGLARKTLRMSSLVTFGATASSPMAVLVGGIVATYAATGNTGVASSFLLLTVVMLLWAPGYIAIARYVPPSGIFYTALAAGLSRPVGVAGAPVVLLAYNTIQISLYGLLGSVASGLIGGPWWAWALLAWAIVATFGMQRTGISTAMFGTILVVEVALLLVFVLMGLAHPAGGHLTFEALNPTQLFGGGVVAGLAVLPLGIAAFFGTETPAAYGAEARSPQAVSRSIFCGILGLGLLYALCAWAMVATVGADQVADLARDPSVPLPFEVFSTSRAGTAGVLLVALGNLLLISSVLAAMISFHNSVARYVFTLGKDRLLPARLATIREGGSGAPQGGSVAQSITALIVLLLFVMSGAEALTMFTWLSNIAAVSLMLLMAVSSLATVRFFAGGGGRNESLWARKIAPTLGGVAIAVILLVTLINISAALGTPPGSHRAWLVPGTVGAFVLVGVLWAVSLRRRRPDLLASVGVRETNPTRQVDEDLGHLTL
ncbi:APC family permease [Micromonospora sp. NPDC048839]|uniref:APC family permease n=1 Tax=Micromonospora sp. NPDC048839 TaxID=3155641 RepID=UPI0033F9C02D